MKITGLITQSSADVFRTLLIAARNDDLCLVETETSDCGTPLHIICAQSKNLFTDQIEFTPLAQLIEGGLASQQFSFDEKKVIS